MKICSVLSVVALGCAVVGCDMKAVKDPPLTVTFRPGVLSKYVMQVSNLSTEEAIEVYVYAANEERSVRSGNVVVPANGTKEFGALEIKWVFQPGDRGFVNPVKYGKKLFFELLPDNQYRTWFGFDDIQEVDVAARIRAQKAVEHAAWLKATTEAACRDGRDLFVAITQSNVEREAAGLGPLWPRPQGTFKERAKDVLRRWKSKVVAEIGKESEPFESGKDVAEKKFKTSGDYFGCLYDVERIGTDKHLPYLTGVAPSLVISPGNETVDGNVPAESVRWSVLADWADDLSEVFPVLISANFPCDKLRSFWDGKESADELIQLSPVGEMGNEAFVVVYKSGQVKAFPADKATLANIYSGAFNTCTNGYNRSVRYLMPNGVVGAGSVGM